MPISISDAEMQEIVLPAYWDYWNDETHARKIFPRLAYSKPGRTVRLPKFGTDHMRYVDGRVGIKTPAAPIDDSVSYTDYLLIEDKRSHTIWDALIDNNQLPVQLMARAAEIIKESDLIAEDVQASLLCMNYSLFPATHRLDPSVAWDQATADIEGDFQGARTAIRGSIGVKPNTLAVTPDVDEFFRDMYADDLLAAGRIAPLEDAELAKKFQVKEYIVLDSQYDATRANETGSLSDIWGSEMALLFYKDTSEDRSRPSFGRTIEHTTESKMYDVKHQNPNGTTLVMEGVKLQKVLSYYAGYLFYDVLS